MSVIRFGGFLGEIPRIHPRLLPEGNGQTAVNTRLDSGALESVRDTLNIQPTTLTNPLSLFRYSDAIWLEATSDADWVTYPIPDDQFGRVIYTGGGATEPRVTDASIVGAGGSPASYWRLDVPAPGQGFTATLNGTADDTDEVPESRYYVCTFVNSYGAEGPPSPASNEVEWRTGQTVTLSNLPAVPSGQYDIAWRRIYRINTGSTGTTNYQFVTEIAVAAANKTVTTMTQANPVVVTTSTAHGLSDGMEVKFTNLGLDATAKTVSNIQKSSPARVTVVGHGYSNGQAVEIASVNGMTQINGTRATISVVDADRFDLVGVDATFYGTYTSGGTSTRAYGMDELDDQTRFISVIDTTSFSLIGEDGTGYKQYFDSGVVTQVAGTSYIDTVLSAALGEVLPTEIYDPPNTALTGIQSHPSGFLVGFFGKTVCFSEIGAPHAWPIDYRMSTNHDIVGIGIFSGSIAVVTKGWPYLIVGSDPAALSKTELEIEQACVSKRGIVDFGSAIAYPSPDGLILLSNAGVQNVTAPLFTREKWQALVPSTFVAFNWEQKYLAFYNDGSVTRAIVVDPFSPMDGVRYVNKYATAGYKDLEEDLLYLVLSNEIEKWDEGVDLEYTWKSKPVYTPRAVNMAGAKVIADDYPVTVEFYVDDVKRHTRLVDSITAFRLPSGFRGEKFELTVKSKKRVSEVIMATTMRELSVTV